MHDLIWRIKEEYNECLDRVMVAKNETEKADEEGQSWAYYRVLEMIESQLFAFGDRSGTFVNLAPQPGCKAEFTKRTFKCAELRVG